MPKRKAHESDEDYQELFKPLLKKPKYSDNDEKNWISGTAVKNYLLQDPALDWLDLYYDKQDNDKQDNNQISNFNKNKLQKQNNNFNNNYLFRLGYKFEDKIYQDLINKYSKDTIKLNTNSREQLSQQSFNKTIHHINKQTPIIMQATLIDKELKLRGIADLLIRSDYINKIFKNKILEDNEIYHNNKLYYLVIDIKYSSMTLCANGKFIRNNDRYKAYKGQLLIYNLILGKIQNFTPRYCYIMAKNWKVDSRINYANGNSCYDLLGIIDYKTFDNKYIQSTKEAIDWVRRVRRYGNNWDIYNPHINNMCLNASNTIDDKWTNIKKDILKQTKDITSIWMLTPQHRNKARELGIIQYNDPQLTVNLLELSDTPTTKVIDNILKINQQSEINILPEKITNKKLNWHKTYPTDFYIDFETINKTLLIKAEDINITKNNNFEDIIFMIGIGYIQNNQWNYLNLTADVISTQEENKLIKEMINFIIKQKNTLDPNNNYPIRLFHWSPAEQTHFNRVMDKNDRLLNILYNYDIDWINLCDIFIKTPIVVRGATTFKLKDIANAMFSLNLITTHWTNSINSGFTAMLSAADYYRNKNNINIITEIEEYNMIDCKVMWDIVAYLRVNKF
jgi:hypothetical protein